MSRTIVVGVDGSENARRALAWALEGAGGASVEAVLAWQPPVVPAPFGVVDAIFDPDDLEAAATEELAVMLEKAQADLPDGTAALVGRLEYGPIGPTLCEAAAEADLLVVGQRGTGGFAGLRLGSVSDYCLHHATVPLAIVPQEARAPVDRIVVGIDGSDASVDALQWAEREAVRRDLPLVAMIAWSWSGLPFGRKELTRPGWTAEQAEEVVAHAVERAQLAREVELDVTNDLPAVALVRASDEGALVVVGAVGHTGLRGRFAGSVSRQVAHHAPGPLVIVR